MRCTFNYFYYYNPNLFQEFLQKDASRKIIQRTRAIQLPVLPRIMNAIDIPQNLPQTIADIPSPFLLHDNKQNGSRLIIFSSVECLQQLRRLTSWYVSQNSTSSPDCRNLQMMFLQVNNIDLIVGIRNTIRHVPDQSTIQEDRVVPVFQIPRDFPSSCFPLSLEQVQLVKCRHT